MAETHSGETALHGRCKNGPIDRELARLIELWPMLMPDDRTALLSHAEHLAAAHKVLATSPLSNEE